MTHIHFILIHAQKGPMDNTKKKIVFRCVETNAPTTTLNEIWPGSLLRRLCIKYHLQVPLIDYAHKKFHAKAELEGTGRGRKNDLRDKKYYQIIYCAHLGIDFYDTNRALQTPVDHEKLEKIGEHCLKKLKSWEM